MSTKSKQQKGSSSIASQLEELEKIVAWFEDQKELDIEAGLAKVKEGAVLIGELKKRITDVENEFEELKGTLDGDVL